jgi:hypothetical protein
MRIMLCSIVGIGSPAERTAAFGQYVVTLRAEAAEHILTYTVELSSDIRAIRWKPSDSILADPNVDIRVVANLTDTVVAFHRGETVEFPKLLSASL